MIYGHYTGTQALVSIIQNQKLWATNIKFLNDEQEFIHAIDISKRILHSSEPRSKVSPSQLIRYDRFISGVTEVLNSLDENRAGAFFTCSFSEEKDLLSQWRGYCGGGAGYCIEFELEGLLEAVLSDFPNSELHRCIYDYAEKKKIISDELNLSWAKYARLDDDGVILDEAIWLLGQRIARHAAYFKHPSFSEEKEWRLVVTGGYDLDGKILFRPGPVSVIPYLALPAPRRFIKKLRIGPSRNQSLATRGLSLFVDSFQLDPLLDEWVSIDLSEIPYRS